MLKNTAVELLKFFIAGSDFGRLHHQVLLVH